MDNEYRESFFARNRRAVFMVAAVLGVALTVVLYYATAPKPTSTSGAIAQGATDLPTLQVGALPVT
jgi:hypothetical protein